MARKKDNHLSFIQKTAESHFGEPVLDIKTPGGSSRASCRLLFADYSVIATKRPNFRRTHLEAAALRNISSICDKVPQFLGLVDDVLFQGDVGSNRLNIAINQSKGLLRDDIADQAVAAIFEIQTAARATLSDTPLPPLGVSENWITSLVDAMDVLKPYGGLSNQLDRPALAQALAVKPQQFVKWDCRSGNAALDTSGKLSWFDFEYCGRRHGAEDLAFLIADEVWPVDPATMLTIVTENLRDTEIPNSAAYLSYLSLYTTFHALQRLTLIVEETRKRGWRSKTRVLERDDVGKHPEFAANICKIGGFFADRHPLTQPLLRNFAAAETAFRHMLTQRRENAIA